MVHGLANELIYCGRVALRRDRGLDKREREADLRATIRMGSSPLGWMRALAYLLPSTCQLLSSTISWQSFWRPNCGLLHRNSAPFGGASLSRRARSRRLIVLLSAGSWNVTETDHEPVLGAVLCTARWPETPQSTEQSGCRQAVNWTTTFSPMASSKLDASCDLYQMGKTSSNGRSHKGRRLGEPRTGKSREITTRGRAAWSEPLIL